MKNIILILTGLIICSTALAQVPQGITNQGVVRDSNNQVIVNSPIGKRVSILQGSVNGNAVYVETHILTTNAYGLITYIIGDGSVVEGVFAEIDWSDGPYFLKTETDPTGGTNYAIIVVTQFLSVPYALYSKTAEAIIGDVEETDPLFTASPAAGIQPQDILNWDEAFSWGDHDGLYRPSDWTPDWEDMPLGDNPGEIRFWDGSEWLAVVPGQYGQTLSFCDGVPTWGPCPPSVPVVTTGAVTGITENSATGAGTVISEGSASVSTRGLVWATDPNPTLQDNDGSGSSGSGTGAFSVQMSGLSSATTYFLRAFATNAEGTAYGSQVSFTTNAATTFIPTVSTNPVTEITETSATTGGNVENDGGSAVSTRGVVWNSSSSPTLENNLGQTSDGVGAGSYTSEITGLEPNTNYYVRAYAVNSQGVSYGNQRVFVTQMDANLPTVITEEATDITQTSATIAGEVTEDGGNPVLARGICWSTEENPTLLDNFNEEGAGLGTFSSNITGLTLGTTYYVRAFATSSQGIAYGNQVNFQTMSLPPEFAIKTVKGSPGMSTVYVIIEEIDGVDIQERGIVWSSQSEPDFDQNEGHIESGSGTGIFSVDITDLIPNSSYFVRAYVNTTEGHIFSDERKFKFWDYYGIVTDFDGNVYNTVKIGEQEWMAENLKTSSYKNGIPISGCFVFPHVGDAYGNVVEGINSDEEMVAAYGKLYTWYAVTDSRGLCPEGWNVPSDADWTELVNYIMDEYDYHNDWPSDDINGVGNALRSCRQVDSPLEGCNTSEHPRWGSSDTHIGFDAFGFSGLPSGYYTGSYECCGFESIGWSAGFWSTTESSTTRAWRYSLGPILSRGEYEKDAGFSVRCFRDIDN